MSELAHAHLPKKAPIYRFIGTRLRAFFGAAKGKRAAKAQLKAEIPKPTIAIGRHNLKAALKLGWRLEDIRTAMPWLGGPHTWDDADAFRNAQKALHVPADGKFGRVSYAALMRQFYGHGYLISNGRPVPAPEGVYVVNWHSGEVEPFEAADRTGRVVDVALGHESTTDEASDTDAVLRRRGGLGVHLHITEQTIEVDGEHLAVVWQHNDLARHRLKHAAGQNGPSVAIENTSRYYPSKRTLVTIAAGWAHKGRYAVPSHATLEAHAVLLRALTSGDLPGVSIPLRWVGLSADGRLAMSRVKGAGRRAGIHAHCYTDHADASFQTLYALLRIEGLMDVSEAYHTALRLAETPDKSVNVRAYLRAEGWRERAAA